MKFNNWIIGLAAVVSLAISPCAIAQNSGTYTPTALSGGTIVMLPALTNAFYVYALTNGVQNGTWTTNSYQLPTQTNGITMNVSEYDYAGITLSENYMVGATNAPIGALIFRSDDFGATWDSNPNWTLTTSPAGIVAGTYTVLTNIDIHGVTTLGLVFTNGTAVGNVSNLVFHVNLKAARIGTQPAGINSGTSPGNPITVPSWP